MKSNGSLVGGTLRPEDADAYARYLAEAVAAYRAAGVAGPGADGAERAVVLAAGLRRDDPGRGAAALACCVDHLAPRSERPACRRTCGRSTTTSTGGPTPTRCCPTRPTAAAVTGVAFHCYRGDVSALRELRDRHPGVPVAVSECSGGAWSPDFARDLRFDARTLLIERGSATARPGW